MYLWDEIKSKYSMADIDITKLVIYRSNIEDEDIDAAKEALEDEYPDETKNRKKRNNHLQYIKTIFIMQPPKISVAFFCK